MENLEDYALNEALRIKWVVRNGKRVKKWVTTKKGRYRVAFDKDGNPKEVRITATERRKRKIGQRRGKLKRESRIVKLVSAVVNSRESQESVLLS